MDAARSMQTNHDAASIVNSIGNDSETRSTIGDGCMPILNSPEPRAHPQRPEAADIERWLRTLDMSDILGVEEHLLQLENLENDEREQTREFVAAERSPASLRAHMANQATSNPPRSSNPREGASLLLTTKQVCTKFREGQEVCRDQKCRKLHVFPKKDCRNASYLECGICSNWSKCRSRHPWDQEKWGNKTDAYEKFKEIQNRERKQNAAEKKTAIIKPRSKANLKKTKEENANKILRMIACQ